MLDIILGLHLLLNLGYDVVSTEKYDNVDSDWRYHGIFQIRADVAENGVCGWLHASALQDLLRGMERDSDLIGCGLFAEKRGWRVEFYAAYDVINTGKYDDIPDSARTHGVVNVVYKFKTERWFVPNNVNFFYGQSVDNSVDISVGTVSVGWQFGFPE